MPRIDPDQTDGCARRFSLRAGDRQSPDTTKEEDVMNIDIGAIKVTLKDISQRFHTLGGYL